jgi:hypothetical protein
MASKQKILRQIQKPPLKINQLISDVEGLEKLQVMLIREIRSQLTKIQSGS